MIMELITVEEIAKKLRVTENWVYLHADDIGAYRLGKYLRFSWERTLECLARKGSLLGCLPNDPQQGIDFTAYKNNREQIGNKSVE
jgi:hypothetical protein